MAARLGRRGSILLILTVIDLAYGYSLIGPSSEAVSSASIAWRERFAPEWAWGTGWLVVGAVLPVAAFMKHDAFGYAAAIGWKILWSVVAMASTVFGGVGRGWVLAVIFGAFGAMVAVCAGWAEPVIPREPDDS
jgi:hypothetical protein